MCAFFSFLNYSPSQFRKKFNVDKLDEKEFEKLQSIKFFPTANIATISQNSPNTLVVRRFGLVPNWYRKPLTDWKASTHNARAESVDEKPTFRHAWSNNQRCLIPVTFWIESQENENEKAPKTPWKISVKGEEAVGIAGIYEDIPDAEGKPIPTCSMITTESIKPLSEVHDRQIVVIKEKDYEKWLSKDTTPDEAKKMLKATKDLELEKIDRAYYKLSAKEISTSEILN